MKNIHSNRHPDKRKTRVRELIGLRLAALRLETAVDPGHRRPIVDNEAVIVYTRSCIHRLGSFLSIAYCFISCGVSDIASLAGITKVAETDVMSSGDLGPFMLCRLRGRF